MDAHVHLTGNVGGDVEFRNANNLPVASFRLANTPRVRRGGEWADGPTTWLTVTCFRGLAEHVASSIRRGDPVVVVGRLRTNAWTKDGVEYERLVLEATTAGHDLTWGTSAFHRSARTSPPADRQSDVGDVISSVEKQTSDTDADQNDADISTDQESAAA